MLLAMAYNVKDFEISGGPTWLDSERYDINAKAEERFGSLDPEKARPMVQALLADRFKVKFHRESKELPVYVLVVAKNGPKLREAIAQNPGPTSSGQNGPSPDPGRPSFRFGRGRLDGVGVAIAMLTSILSNQLGRYVLDKTELKGTYDFQLKWTPDQNQPDSFSRQGIPPPQGQSEDGPTLFTALQEQLGLKLESQRGPVEILVIDYAAKPPEN